MGKFLPLKKFGSNVRHRINHWAETVLSEPALAQRRVRLGFWIFGLASGSILAYTTRHYINGDAIAYLDMAEALRRGLWSESVNLTYAPGYPLLLSLAQTLIPIDALNEITLAKLLNLLCFVVTMAVCDLFVRELKTFSEQKGTNEGLPFPALSAICYSSFLFTSLTWVRIQIITPDMLVFIFLMLCAIAIMRILSSPDGYRGFIFLGLVAGLGDLSKTSFFPFSAIVFACAAAACRSVTHAIPRFSAALAVMLLVSSPVLISQSLKVGRLSIGEAGTYNYAYWVSGAGQAVHQPEVVHEDPKVLVYRHEHVSTYPPGDDPSYWALGIRPVFDIGAQVRAIRSNLEHLLGRTGLIGLVIIVWFIAQFRRAKLTGITLHPPSLSLVLIVFALAGVAMHCLVVMEIRYVGPFLFLGIVGLALLPGFDRTVPEGRSATVLQGALLSVFFVANVAYFVVDESIRATYTAPGKVSHSEVFAEGVALKEFFDKVGVGKGDEIVIFRPPGGSLYWARMAGVRATGEIADAKDFLDQGARHRALLLNSLKHAGFKAVVAKGQAFAALLSEGWFKPSGTRDYYVYVFAR